MTVRELRKQLDGNLSMANFEKIYKNLLGQRVMFLNCNCLLEAEVKDFQINFFTKEMVITLMV